MWLGPPPPPAPRGVPRPARPGRTGRRVGPARLPPRRNRAEGIGGPEDPTILLDPEDVVESSAGLPVLVELAEVRRRAVEGAPRPALDTVAVLRRTADPV